MASRLRLVYEVSEARAVGKVRQALNNLTEDDLSESSPITPGGNEVGLGRVSSDGGPALEIVIEGHDGDWTKTSQEAVKDAAEGVEGIGDLLEHEGGYEG